MNKLQRIIGVGIMALGLTSCIPPKLEFSGNVNGEQVEYYENLIMNGDTASYDVWSTYEINIAKKNDTQVKYICDSRHGELILRHIQINNGQTVKDYYKDEVLSTDIIKAGQLEVNDYIEKIRTLKK
jgi:hypothetical protein